MDDQDHLAVIGDASDFFSARAQKIGPALQRVQPGWMRSVSPQGVSSPAEELDYLPLDGVDYTDSGGGSDLEDKLEGFPQRPFRGERIILTCTYLIAAGGGVSDALYRMIITPAVYVGATQVGATQGRMPGAAFGPTSFGVRLSMPSAGQGTRVYIPFIFPGVGAGDRVIVAGGIFGRAVR